MPDGVESIGGRGDGLAPCACQTYTFRPMRRGEREGYRDRKRRAS